MVAHQSWQRSATRTFTQKTKFLASDLRKWRKSKPRIPDQLAAIETQLLQLQSKPPNQQDHSLQNHLTHQHHELLAKDEIYHLQRAKKDWAANRDRNTTFFHHSIIKRNRRNRVTYLHNPDGSLSTTPDQLANTLIHYFQSIFTSQSQPTNQTTSTQQLPPSPVTLPSHAPNANINHHNPACESTAVFTRDSLVSPANDTYTNSIPDM